MKKIFITLLTLYLATGLFAQPLVYTPAMKSPVNDAVKQMPDVTVSWYAITGSLNLQYQVQIDTTPNFNSPLKIDATQTLLTGYTTNELLFGTKYFWRVRAIDGDTSPWSEVWNFTVFSQMELSIPANSAVDQNPNVELQWKSTVNNVALTGVTQFDYEMDTTLNFNSPLLHAGTVNSDIYKFSANGLLFGTKYFWRVRTKHALSTSDWCDPFNFTTLDKVTLQAPPNNSTDEMLDTDLKWKIVVGAMSYVYQVSTDPTFASLLLETETDTNVVPATMLQFDTKYYWRVRARLLADTSGWATPSNFTTIATVELSSPANNAQGVLTLPLMQWSEMTGIDKYEIQIDETSSFTTPYIDAQPAYDQVSYQVIKALAGQTTYFWRMRAMSNGGPLADTTDWSPVWSFTTGFAIGIDDPSAFSFSLYPNPAGKITTLRASLPEASVVSFELIDLLGKTMLQNSFGMKAGNQTHEIRLGDLKKGIYVARLTVNGKSLHQKLIVE